MATDASVQNIQIQREDTVDLWVTDSWLGFFVSLCEDYMAEDTGMSRHLGALASRVDFKMSLLKDVMVEYREIKHKDLLASKNTLVEARDAVVALTEEISQKNCYLELLKKKLQESEAKNNRAEQQCGSVTENIQPRGVETRSMQKRKRPSEGPLDYGADENGHTGQLDGLSMSPLESSENLNVPTGSIEEQIRLSERPLGNDAVNLEVTEECRSRREGLVNSPPVGQTSFVMERGEDDLEAVRDELIKGFLEIDTGGRKIGIKEMGELNEKAFKAACLAKVPPEEVATASYELYSSWQKQLGDLSWYPFKTVIVDGNHQIVNVDDDKLQELKRAWGSGAHDAVVNALVEMKQYDRLRDRSIAFELWNYKEGRRATTRECINYMSNQVKKLTVTKRRKIRR
ncbi:factor of DNA methylation 2-like isoform X2 [Panicum miliaceum]|uniref:Factor of DNA methylation 2-like isoform X2 n=1 Tax=Panicum miliaceum TaxID=4540 RepID=A0A3L6T155_PANMI|nr:factor of DNA methylation 2-like isoform X2 [Panicum miliaceum]